MKINYSLTKSSAKYFETKMTNDYLFLLTFSLIYNHINSHKNAGMFLYVLNVLEAFGKFCMSV